MKLLFKLSILITTLLIQACATTNQASKQLVFNEQSTTGVIVFGVDISGYFNTPKVTFAQFNPETMTQIPNSSFTASPRLDDLYDELLIEEGDTGRDAGGHNYFVLEMPAGHWFLKCTHGHQGNGAGTVYKNSTCFKDGTFAFSNEPGKAAYIGEFKLKSHARKAFELTVSKPDITKAKLKMKEFPGISPKLTGTKGQYVSYQCLSRLPYCKSPILRVIGLLPKIPADIADREFRKSAK